MLKTVLYWTLTGALLASAGSALAADHVVEQKDKAFSVDEIKVKAGDTITFQNKDDVAHNIFSKDAGNEFEIPKQDPGATGTITFKTPGEVKIRCAIHPKMKLVVTVE